MHRHPKEQEKTRKGSVLCCKDLLESSASLDKEHEHLIKNINSVQGRFSDTEKLICAKEQVEIENTSAAAIRTTENNELKSKLAGAEEQNLKYLKEIGELEKAARKHSASLDFLMVYLRLPLLNQDPVTSSNPFSNEDRMHLRISELSKAEYAMTAAKSPKGNSAAHSAACYYSYAAINHQLVRA
jgi:hypothetical protein